MELTRHLVPHLKAQGGLVVNISSLQVQIAESADEHCIAQGRIAIPHRAAYAASKHALQVLPSQAILKEYSEKIHHCRPGPTA